MVLEEYYGHVDGPRPADGLAVATPDVQFYLSTPGRTIEGRSRDDLAAYLAGRPPESRDRVHHLLASATHGDLEFHYGVVLEGGAPTGALLGAVHTTPDGRFDRYIVLFQPAVTLLD